MKKKIRSIVAHEILDSRGNPTVHVRVETDAGIIAEAAVPSGASTGMHEALELRDADASRYNGLGVLKACENVNTILAKDLKGADVTDQIAIDKRMRDIDGTENKSSLGANAILGVSLAVAQAGAVTTNRYLYEYIRASYGLKFRDFHMPKAMINLINGGKHADNKLSLQEFMVVPQKDSMKESVRAGSEIFFQLRRLLKKSGLSSLVGDEGGCAPLLSSNEESFELLVNAIERAGYIPGQDVSLAVDVAASTFYDKEKKIYHLELENKDLDYKGMTELYRRWIKSYPIISIEDGLAEDDWEGWGHLYRELGQDILIVGDDLFVTNIERLKQGIDSKVANATIIKPNQIGTLTETIDAINLAQMNGYDIIVSNRSGETTDTTIADLSLAVNAEYIKTGSITRGERTAKYNRLLLVEENIS